MERSNDYADCGRDTKFNPLVLDEIHAADDTRSPRTIEQMLENMFVGRPPGNYDRLLDFSFAKTGNLFFVPSATFLENVDNDAPPAGRTLSETPALAAPQPVPKRDGSLGIGSLKGDPAS